MRTVVMSSQFRDAGLGAFGAVLPFRNEIPHFAPILQFRFEDADALVKSTEVFHL